MINILNNIRQTTTFFKSLSFRPEVISTLKELNEIFDIHFVSKPSEKVASQSEHIKAKLIYDSLWNERRKKLHLTFDKTMRRWNILVDDDPNIYHNKNYKPNRTHILMDQPHNQHINQPRLFLTKQKERQKIIEENLY
jgi:5'(3')-deoxyribonucleotidase